MSKTTFLLGLLVLVLATGGTATAAKLITGKQVKNSSLTGADVKDGSLQAADLEPGVRRSLAAAAAPGATGPAGPAGPAGDTGPQGPDGTPGGRTRAAADAAYLPAGAKAADTARLGDVDGDDFVLGDLDTAYQNLSIADGGPEFELANLGYATVLGECANGDVKTVRIDTDGVVVDYTRSIVFSGSPSAVAQDSAPANGVETVVSETGSYQAILHLRRPGANALAAEDFATLTITAADMGGTCRFQTQILDHERDQTTLVINP